MAWHGSVDTSFELCLCGRGRLETTVSSLLGSNARLIGSYAFVCDTRGHNQRMRRSPRHDDAVNAPHQISLTQTLCDLSFLATHSSLFGVTPSLWSIYGSLGLYIRRYIAVMSDADGNSSQGQSVTYRFMCHGRRMPNDVRPGRQDEHCHGRFFWNFTDSITLILFDVQMIPAVAAVRMMGICVAVCAIAASITVTPTTLSICSGTIPTMKWSCVIRATVPIINNVTSYH